MKTYIITVNGKSYEVAVEEKDGSQAVKPAVASAMSAPAKPAVQSAAPAVPVSQSKEKKPAVEGGTQVAAPMPGKIISVKVNVGDTVKADQELIIMEAMKMHNPILSSGDGVIKQILVKPGDAVQTGNVLIVLG